MILIPNQDNHLPQTQWILWNNSLDLILGIIDEYLPRSQRKCLIILPTAKDRFTYKDDFGANLNFKPKNNQYFLESKLEFLDNPGEWFYEKQNGVGTLYVMTMDGKSPEDRNIRGKVNL